MLDLVAQAFWFGGLPIAAVLAVFVYVRTNATLARKVVASILSFLSVFSFSYVLAGSLFFRDGLAPGSIPSEGLLAIRRAAGGFWMAVLVGAIFAIVGVLVARGPKQSKGAA